MLPEVTQSVGRQVRQNLGLEPIHKVNEPHAKQRPVSKLVAFPGAKG